MNKDQKKIRLILTLIAALAGCFVSFSLGRNSAESEYRKEKELAQRIARSELEGLGEVTETIYVFGHKSPNSDTVASSIAFADLLKKLGYDAQPSVLGELNKESVWILKKAGVPVPDVLLDAAEKSVILVDHSDYLNSADHIGDAKILAVLDHHGVNSVTAGNPIIFDVQPIGAASTIVFQKYESYGVTIDPDMAAVLLGGVLSDTVNTKAERTTFADREAIRALSAIAEISDTDTFFKEMTMSKYDYSGMSDEEIFESDIRQYHAGGKVFSIGAMDAYDEESAKDLSVRMKRVMPKMNQLLGTDFSIALISIFHDDLDISYLIPDNETADEIIREAYGKEAEFDGTAYKLSPGYSRKKFAAAFTELLESYPKE